MEAMTFCNWPFFVSILKGKTMAVKADKKTVARPKKKAKGKKIGDMTVEELRAFVKKVVLEVVDPDYGLELRPEVEKELLESLQSKERIPVEDVTKELGLRW